MFAELLDVVGARGLVYGEPTLYRVPERLMNALPLLPFGATDSPAEVIACALGRRPLPPPPPVSSAQRGPELILLGASTGGITALETVLSVFPADCPPTLVVQHIRPGFIESTIQRLELRCRPRIVPARENSPIAPGYVYVAADPDRHLTLCGRAVPRCRMVASPPCHGHRPSVDRLFESAVPYAPRTTAALLTGMGVDGAAGLAALRAAGAFTIAQDRATSVVWGMPRAAVEIGAAAAVLPIERIGEALLLGRAPPSMRSGMFGIGS